MHQEVIPFISIIIPARDEEKYLPMSLSAIKVAAQQIKEQVEIIVVINRCTDNTEKIAREAGCRIVYDNTKNLAHIRNTGVRAAKGEIIVTIDADSVMSPNMLKNICKKMLTNKYVGGGVVMFPERWSLGIIMTFIALLPIAIWHRILGGLFFCKKEDFDAINGFNETLPSVEDIDFAKRLKALGKKSRRKFALLFSSYIVTSCRKFDKFGDWYFLLHPFQFVRILRGKDAKLADKVWYDFER
jgi:glycosyltransferase involved in cell wall biosynthesis